MSLSSARPSVTTGLTNGTWRRPSRIRKLCTLLVAAANAEWRFNRFGRDFRRLADRLSILSHVLRRHRNLPARDRLFGSNLHDRGFRQPQSFTLSQCHQRARQIFGQRRRRLAQGLVFSSGSNRPNKHWAQSAHPYPPRIDCLPWRAPTPPPPASAANARPTSGQKCLPPTARPTLQISKSYSSDLLQLTQSYKTIIPSPLNRQALSNRVYSP